MGFSYSFSFSCVDLINKTDFEIVKSTLKEFFSLYQLNFEKEVCEDKTSIECFNVNLYAHFNFIEESKFFLMAQLWKNNFIPFEFGVEIIEGVPTDNYDLSEYEKWKNKIFF